MNPLLHEGVAHHQAGRLAQAERCYRAVLAVPLLVHGQIIGAIGVSDRPGLLAIEDEPHPDTPPLGDNVHRYSSELRRNV